MIKRLRLKKERNQVPQLVSNQPGQTLEQAKPKGFERFLLWVVRIGTVAVLFTPLVVHYKFYYPFIGPKALYLMGFCQLVFFVWLFLAIHSKRYRPNRNKVSMAFALFFIVLILSSLFGVDLSRSFWSNFERMTGLLLWLHLFGWFLAISSSFRKLSDWRWILWISVAVGGLIAFFSLLSEIGVAVYTLGGSALGNTSFLGTYLLLNVFFALYLFFKEKKRYLKVVTLVIAVLSALSIYLVGARAATLGIIGGVGLICLLYCTFKVKNRGVKIAGKIALITVSLVVLLLVILLFVPKSPVSDKFVELTTESRAVNWQMAWQGFQERPLFGWGPENYSLFFTKFFNPCLFAVRCGGEAWFDKAHNIVIDTLLTTGIFGLLAYLGMFVVMAYVLIKKYFKEKTISFWLFAVFLTLFVAYFIHNLTVFDTPTSLMLFVLILGFIAFLEEKPTHPANTQKPWRAWVAVLLIIIFLCTFFKFVIQPMRTDIFVMKAVSSNNPSERMEYYKKTFEASPIGKYQIRNYFAQNTQSFVLRNSTIVPKETLQRELDYIISEQIKTIEETPIDFRTTLKIAQMYHVYAILDASKLELVEKYSKEAMALSPTHQQPYISLLWAKFYKKDFDKAIELAQAVVELEPEWLRPHQILVQVAQETGQYEKAKEFMWAAVQINPEWTSEFQDILGDIEENSSEL